MRKSRFSEAQIAGFLKELDAGTPATELARKHGVHANTIRLWRDRYGGMETSDLVRLKQLEAENAQMQRIIARQTSSRALSFTAPVGQPAARGYSSSTSSAATRTSHQDFETWYLRRSSDSASSA